MSKYRESVLTDGGLNLARQAENARIKITFTKAVLSAEDHTSDSMQALEQLTTLNSFVQSDPINYTNILNATDVAVPLRFSNVNQTTNNYINTIGLYATDGTTEVLHSVIVNDDPELFPVYNGSTPQYVKVNFETEVGRTSQINANVSPMGMVTEEEFSAATKNWELSASHSSDVSSLSAEIGSVSSAIANNSGIASEFSSVSSGVANNSSAVTLLQSSVSTNSSAIGSLQTSVNSNSSNINTLQTSVSNNANSITNLSNNKVQDNHDGTVTVNGNVYAISQYISGNVDFNNLTTPGRYLINVSGSGNSNNSPSNNSWDYMVDVYVEPNGSINQVARTSGRPGEWYRTRYNNNWAGWQETAFKSDVVNLQNAVNGVLARQSTLISQLEAYISLSLSRLGFNESDWTNNVTSTGTISVDWINKRINITGNYVGPAVNVNGFKIIGTDVGGAGRDGFPADTLVTYANSIGKTLTITGYSIPGIPNAAVTLVDASIDASGVNNYLGSRGRYFIRITKNDYWNSGYNITQSLNGYITFDFV